MVALPRRPFATRASDVGTRVLRRTSVGQRNATSQFEEWYANFDALTAGQALTTA